MNKLLVVSVVALLLVVAFAAPVLAQEGKRDIMPPLSGDGSGQTYAQAVWVMIIFVILLAVLYPTAWKNVLAGLKKREDKIRADIAMAESMRGKAEGTLREYNSQLAAAEERVKKMFDQAAVDAEKIAAGIRTHAQQEAEEIKERAIKEIEASKQQALTEIYEQTANLSTSIAEKILKRSLNADDQRDLVAAGLEQLQTLSAGK